MQNFILECFFYNILPELAVQQPQNICDTAEYYYQYIDISVCKPQSIQNNNYMDKISNFDYNWLFWNTIKYATFVTIFIIGGTAIIGAEQIIVEKVIEGDGFITSIIVELGSTAINLGEATYTGVWNLTSEFFWGFLNISSEIILYVATGDINIAMINLSENLVEFASTPIGQTIIIGGLGGASTVLTELILNNGEMLLLPGISNLIIPLEVRNPSGMLSILVEVLCRFVEHSLAGIVVCKMLTSNFVIMNLIHIGVLYSSASYLIIKEIGFIICGSVAYSIVALKVTAGMGVFLYGIINEMFFLIYTFPLRVVPIEINIGETIISGTFFPYERMSRILPLMSYAYGLQTLIINDLVCLPFKLSCSSTEILNFVPSFLYQNLMVMTDPVNNNSYWVLYLPAKYLIFIVTGLL